MQNRLSLIMLLCWLGSFSLFAQKKYSLQSPDQQLQTEVFVDEAITFSLSRQGKTLLAPSEVALTLGNGTVLGSHPKVLKVFKSIADKEIASPFYKKSTVKDAYNEMRINFKGDFSLTFRLYDDGMAYRFSTHKYAFDRDMQQVVEHYARMGVKGFKIDFMDRDDQEIIQFLYRAAQCCADHKMLVDFHGICKPTGLQRTYPNVLNYEGVHGLEQVKWSPESNDMVTYDVTIPFIRMVAGPMDYTQGAMRNAGKGNYAAIYSEPMSQGTRCRQLATYVIFESPFNMLCDSPSNYEREEECTRFIAQIPTVWDKTIALDGKVGEHITMARRKGSVWYVGALTGWTPRDITLDLSFLGKGDYVMELYKDGVNADRAGHDYKKEMIPVPAHRKIVIHLAPGGGCAARITKQ